LPPAVTGSGVSVLVIERSAPIVAAPTVVVSVSILLAGLLSLVEVLTKTVLLMFVPAGVPAFTLTT
jgi:hypothetical protein